MKKSLMLKLAVLTLLFAGIVIGPVWAQSPLELNFGEADFMTTANGEPHELSVADVPDDREFYTSWGASIAEVAELENGTPLETENAGPYTTVSYASVAGGYDVTVFYLFQDNKLYSTNYKFERLESDRAAEVAKELEGYITRQMNQPRYLRGDGSLLFSDGHTLAEYFWYVDGQTRDLPPNIKPFFNRITFQDAHHADVRPDVERFTRYWDGEKSLMNYYEKGDLMLTRQTGGEQE